MVTGFQFHFDRLPGSTLRLAPSGASTPVGRQAGQRFAAFVSGFVLQWGLKVNDAL